VATIDVRETVSELKRQRQAIDRALAALEAIRKSRYVQKRKRVRAGSPPNEMKDGTTGRVIPFALEQRRP
jgi:hypothetical protein